MIGAILKSMQLIILLLILFVVLKLFYLPSLGDMQEWVDYRTAIAHIERKDSQPLDQRLERWMWRIPQFFSGQSDREIAIHLLCKLAKKGKEEAQLLLLIYDMGMADCLAQAQG